MSALKEMHWYDLGKKKQYDHFENKLTIFDILIDKLLTTMFCKYVGA